MQRPVLFTFMAALLIATSPAGAAEAPRIEVAFAMDATGSMGPYIAQARARIGQIADSLAQGEPKPDVRFALVAYRDKGDAFVTRARPFTRELSRMKAYLDETQADGGGDTPEAVLEAVKAALTELGWSKPSARGDSVVRLLYLVGDAPAQHHADSPSEAWLAAEARRRGVVIHGIACGSDGDLEPSFETLARHTEGRFFRLSDSARSVARAGVRAKDPGLAATLADTTRAYSTSVGVDYAGAAAEVVTAAPLGSEPALAERSGLLGAHARWARNARVWDALWKAHVSVLPAGEQPPAPAVDFARQHVLVLGGADAGLELLGVERRGAQRSARVKPSSARGVRFFVLPSQAAR